MQLQEAVFTYLAEKLGEEYAREVAPMTAFVGGFAWDALTLSRIDRWFDLTLLSVYLAGAAFLLNMDSQKHQPSLSALRFIKNNTGFIFHFFIGGLFSAFVVFVFKSVTLSKSLIFLVLIAGVFVLNEWTARRATPVLGKLALLNLAGSMYGVFVIPLLLLRIDYPVFLLAGILSGTGVFFMGRRIYVKSTSGEELRRSLIQTGKMVAGMALLLNVLYMLKWIPPVPLVLKDAMLATHVARDAKTGEYDIVLKETPWWMFWRDYSDSYAATETSRLYVYASVFAPSRLNTTLFHVWEWKDPKKGWIPVDHLKYTIHGGRDGGYRGYTYKSTLQKGEWRVRVTTSDGRRIGTLHFEMI